MTNSISARHKYPSFDLLKLLLAYFVVAIHSNMNNYSGWIEHVIYTAVPIFFSISGFLMYSRYQDVSYIKNYCLKIFKLYFLWTILYLPLTIYGIKINNLHGFSIIESLIRGTFIMGENYMSWPLWYLWALFIGTLIIRIMIRLKISIDLLFVIGLLLFTIGNSLNEINQTPLEDSAIRKVVASYFDIFMTTRNGLFTAIPYISAGLLTAKYRNFFLGRRTLFAICLIVSCVSYWNGAPYSIIFLSIFIVVGASFIYLPNRKFWVTLRNMSTLIYFTHMYFVFEFQQICQMSEFSVFAISTTLATVLSYSLIKVSQQQRFAFLNKLITG